MGLRIIGDLWRKKTGEDAEYEYGFIDMGKFGKFRIVIFKNKLHKNNNDPVKKVFLVIPDGKRGGKGANNARHK